MKRRDVIKGLTLLPIAGGVLSNTAEAVSASSVAKTKIDWFKELTTKPSPGPLKAGPQIYQSIGVEPIINGRGTFTVIGASVELPEVRLAMEYAAQYNVQIDELAFGVGQRLAEITGAEYGMVSSGCAAGMKHVTLGVLTGGNPEKLIRIPNLAGFDKTEVIIPRSSRNVYDHAIRICGVTIITVNTLQDLKDALSSRTAMIYMTPGGEARAGIDPSTTLSVENVANAAKAFNVPVLVDAAAERLTIPNIHLQAGAAVVAYSGGKVIRGPQCAGLLLGRKDILMSAWQASAPHHGPARDNKVGREEQIGMLAAVEAWASRDHAAEMKTWLSWMQNIADRFKKIDGVTTSVREASAGLSNASPSVSISWDAAKFNITGTQLAAELQTTAPRVAVSGSDGGGARTANTPAANAPMSSVSVTGYMLTPGQDKIIADRIIEVLTRKRTVLATAAAMAPPAATITGRWIVDMEFFSGKSQHIITIEKQDENFVQGAHKADYATRDLIGTVDGNNIMFQSRWQATGDQLTYTFRGILNGDTITGDIDMGEYITAKFTAKKYTYPSNRNRIVFPSGRPLST